MSGDHPGSPQEPGGSERLIRNWGSRYLGVLCVVAGLLLVDQAVLQPLLIRLNGFGPVINLAGRQRMLSQRMTKAVLAISIDPASSSEWHDELHESLQSWRSVHHGLLHGDASLHLPGTRDADIVAAFDQLEPHFQAMSAAVGETLAEPATSSTTALVLLEHEGRYLAVMDRIVNLFEQRVSVQVQWLRMLGIVLTLAVLTAMLALTWLVVRPAEALIREQWLRLEASRADLETRVTARTRELLAANQELAREVAEREVAENNSRQLQSQLAQAARVTSLGQFATGLAHELNQPLGAISTFADAMKLMIRRPEISRGDVERTADRLRDAALRAGQIVVRMRSFLKQKPAERQTTTITPLIEDVLALCGGELQKQRVIVHKSLSAADGIAVGVDVIQIQQVLVNLVQNALQAMSTVTGRPRELTIAAHRDHERLVLIVEDSGPGFPVDWLGEDLATFRSTRPEGLGMGLSISQSLLHAHQGELRIGNCHPYGARVTFFLPVQHDSIPQSPADSLCCR